MKAGADVMLASQLATSVVLGVAAYMILHQEEPQVGIGVGLRLFWGPRNRAFQGERPLGQGPGGKQEPVATEICCWHLVVHPHVYTTTRDHGP